MPKNYCIMQIWAESGKSALPICNYSQILYQFLTFTQNLKRSLEICIDLFEDCERNYKKEILLRVVTNKAVQIFLLLFVALIILLIIAA